MDSVLSSLLDFDAPLVDIPFEPFITEHVSNKLPTKSDDASLGYSIGCKWCFIKGKPVFICTDNTINKSKWEIIHKTYLNTKIRVNNPLAFCITSSELRNDPIIKFFKSCSIIIYSIINI